VETPKKSGVLKLINNLKYFLPHMNIIKNYAGWLSENLQPTVEAAAGPVTGSLMTDITSSTSPFGKWSLSKAKPGFLLFPSWRLSPNKAEHWIEIDAYAFTKGKNAQGVESRIIAANYRETLDIFLPKGHPSAANKSDFRLPSGPNDTGTEVNTYNYEGNPLPTEKTLAEIAKKYPTNDDGTKWDPKNSTGSLGPNAVLRPSGEDRMDGFAAFAIMVEKDPSLTPDSYLEMLERSLAGAKALMATQLKSGSAIARIRNVQVGDPAKVNALVAKVKALPEYAAAPAPAAAPGAKPTARG
jgi:hypothetical protein